MWRGNHTRRRPDVGTEEEGSPRRNLSRLIHTVQHIPSHRFQLDTDSLWNFVRELETFNPPQSMKSDQTSKMANKKKCLNAKLCSSLHTSPQISKSREMHNKTTYESKTKSKTHKKLDIINNKKQTSVENSNAHHRDKRHKNENNTNQLPFKTIKSITTVKNDSSYENSAANRKTSYIKTKNRQMLNKQLRNGNQRYKEKSNDYTTELNQNEFKIIDKVIELQGSDNINLDNKSSSKLVMSSVGRLDADQSSLVKTLTHYWNNLLSTECDESADSESRSSSSKSIESINHISIQSFKNDLSISKSSVHSFYGSSRSILKTENALRYKINESLNKIYLDDSSHEWSITNKIGCGDNQGIVCSQSKIINEDLYLENYYSTSKEASSEVCCSSYSNHSMTNESHLGAKFDITTEKTVEVLKDILNKLVLFPKQSILSKQLDLSQPVKTMLCLMTATQLSDLVESQKSLSNQNFDIDKEQEIELKRTFEEDNDWSVPDDEDLNNCMTLVVPGITLQQVHDVLRNLSLIKECIWMNFLLCDQFKEQFHDYSKQHSPSFTFIYEEQIVLEDEDSNDEDNFSDDEDNEMNEDNITSVSLVVRFINTFSTFAENIVDSVLADINYYWPDTFKGFIRTLYQLMVSIMIWWVIIKEITK